MKISWALTAVMSAGAASPAFAQFDADCSGWSFEEQVWIEDVVKLNGIVLLVRNDGSGMQMQNIDLEETYLHPPGAIASFSGGWYGTLPPGDYIAIIAIDAHVFDEAPFVTECNYQKFFSCSPPPQQPAQERLIDVGFDAACAIDQDAHVRCWGANHWGQLGNGTTQQSLTPVVVPGIENAIAVTTGVSHACALLADGTVWCWGRNGDRELPDRSFTPFPFQIPGITNAVSIDAGYGHTCALLTDGSARCWGSNFEGQLGDGTRTHSPTAPVTVVGLPPLISISAGGYHSCAVAVDGSAWCWGYQLSQVPARVPGIVNARQISSANSHDCVVLANFNAQCWGYNGGAQLGDGTSSPRSGPVNVQNLWGVTQISAMTNHTCARLFDDTVRCWGQNYVGQIGIGQVGGWDGQSFIDEPTAPAGNVADVATIAAGFHGTCAITNDRTVRCWGDNYWGPVLGLAAAGAPHSTVPIDLMGF